MIVGMSIATFTLVHVVVSLIGIFSFAVRSFHPEPTAQVESDMNAHRAF